jgi:hypothetical protein
MVPILAIFRKPSMLNVSINIFQISSQVALLEREVAALEEETVE